MTGDYHEERTLVLNEHDSWPIFLTWFTVKNYGVMVLEHIAVILWRSVVLVGDTSENHRPVPCR